VRPSSTDEWPGTDGLDRLLEHRIRFAICVLLSRNDSISFSRFKELFDETDGNLGAQLRTLEEAGYIVVRKEFRDRKPVSWYSLRPKGRKALVAHVETLGNLLTAVRRE
jgi:DNA-binding PadR family transcriptional regulator